jgi:large subunit ribosomal protein L15
MVVRKRKKFNKKLGQRTRGKGDTKKRRGAGSRGGRGLAGSHKHKFQSCSGKFGTEKKKVRSRKLSNAINIEGLLQAMPRLVAEGKVSKEGNALVVDGTKIGFDKILSRGELREKLVVRNMAASKKAAEKISSAGGSIESEEAVVAEEEGGEAKGEEEGSDDDGPAEGKA